MIKGIIFDLDGTLLNTIDDIADSVNTVLERNGLPTYTTEQFKSFVGSGARKLIHSALGEHDNEEIFEKIYEEYFDYYKVHRTDRTNPYDGIKELLAKLKKDFKLGVLSNKPHHDTVPMVKSYFGEDTFDFIFGQRDGYPRKPDPTVALQIVADMGLTPEEVAYIGDSENDVLTANNSKCLAICVLWGFRTYETMKNVGECDIFVNTPDELYEKLEKLK